MNGDGTGSRIVALARYDVLAVLCLSLGILLLAQNLGAIAPVTWVWPMLVTLAGAALIVSGHGRGRFGYGMIGTGTYVLLSSGLFMYMNLTSWSRMAKCWPLFIGFLGAAIFVSGFGWRRRGPPLFLSVLLVLVSLALFLIFSVSVALWPVSLLCLGVSLLFLGRTVEERHA